MEKKIAFNVSINHFCNQKCFFCIDDTRQFLNFLKTDTDKKIFTLIDSWIWKFENIVFTSWEPTLNKNFHKYIDHAKKNWFENIALITNWSTLDDLEVRKKILEYGLDEVIVSVHGIWEMHDKMTWVKWSFQKLFRWFYELIKENNWRVKISMSFVLNSANYKQYSKYIELFIWIWVDQIIINALRPEWLSWWDKYKKYFIDYTEFIKFNQKLSSKEKNLINSLIEDNRLVFTDFPTCVIHNSWLKTNLIGTVELRVTHYWLDKDEDGVEQYDNNNCWKKHIEKCNECLFKNNCEWINVTYLNLFWEKWIIPVIQIENVK